MTADHAPAPTAEAEHAANGARGRIRLFSLIALTIVLLTLCVVLAVPFLPAITWAAALAILAWPMHQGVRRFVRNPWAAAGISTCVVAGALAAIGAFVVYQIVREAETAVIRLQRESDEAGGIEAKAAEIPVLRRALMWMNRMDVDVLTEVGASLRATTRSLTRFTRDSFVAAVQFLVAMFILYYLFQEPWTFLEEIRELLPLSRAESDFVMVRAADSVHANLHATVVTGILNAGSFGLLFWWMGLPAPLLWTVVMFVLSVLPIVGAGLVWGPAAVYLALSGRWAAAAGLVVWGLLNLVAIGYFLYGRLVGKRMRMHEVPALLSFLGGLAIFGLSGMVLGPAIVAVTMALLEVWRRRMMGGNGEG